MESVSYQPFRTARPVWPLGQETAFNVTCRFHAAVPAGSATLYLTASTLYRLFVNGAFVAYGPARGPKDYYRVDELDLTPYLTESENVLAIEVFGYNANSYYTLDQASFLQAEVRAGEAVLAATGADSATFLCVPVPERTQKVQRYSFQRPFAEHWTLTPAYAKGLRTMPASGCALAEQAEKALLPRRVSMPELARFPASEVVANGSVVANAADPAAPDKVLSAPSDTQKAWPTEELAVRLSLDAAAYAYTPAPLTDASPEGRAFPANSYAIYRFAYNQTGFLTLNVRCDEPVTLVALFDELLLENDVDWTRLGCCNVLRFDLAPGSYSLLSAEANTMGAMKLVALGGACTVEQVALIEYQAPLTPVVTYDSPDEDLRKIWDAAVRSYRQNAVDLFTDCPHRERAGWLCDSYFTARVEYLLTGKSTVEYNFLENFLLPDSFPNLPEGMFPMCYPGDHPNGNFIPNWAMWLVLQLREYAQKRGGDPAMIEAFRPKIYALLAYLDTFLNEDGLLEKLPSWVFVEWSRANKLVQDVNYPSNMLYAAVKEAVADLYGDESLRAVAATMKDTIRKQSLTEVFYQDNAVRNAQGELVPSGECTEVCQYYAFYFGIADAQRDPELWRRLLTEFGPQRRVTNPYPEVAYSNAFIGDYLRMEILERAGDWETVLRNIHGYFLVMAEKTGTLWEHQDIRASCNHGFASHIVCWLYAALQKGYPSVP